MEHKKNNNADLEKKRVVYIEYGLVLVLAILLLAFEVGQPLPEIEKELKTEAPPPEEDVDVTRPDVELPPPPPPPQVIEDFKIFEDDELIDEDEFDINSQIGEDDATDWYFSDDGSDEAVEETPFIVVEDMPEFMGKKDQEALNEFRNWVQKRLVYPDIAAENGISGKVFIQFVVTSQGKVDKAKVIRGVDPALDEEALRVVKNSPQWVPGKQRGRAVPVQFTFPITFMLQ